MEFIEVKIITNNENLSKVMNLNIVEWLKPLLKVEILIFNVWLKENTKKYKASDYHTLYYERSIHFQFISIISC
jgi:hypothetical protein